MCFVCAWQADSLRALEKQNQDMSAKLEKAVEEGGSQQFNCCESLCESLYDVFLEALLHQIRHALQVIAESQLDPTPFT